MPPTVGKVRGMASRIGDPVASGWRRRTGGTARPISAQTSVGLAAGQLARLDQRARQAGTTRAEEVRQAVAGLLAHPPDRVIERAGWGRLDPRRTVVLAAGQRDALHRLAAEFGVSVADLIRYAVERHLDAPAARPATPKPEPAPEPEPGPERWTAAECAAEWGITPTTWSYYARRRPPLAPPPAGKDRHGRNLWDPDEVRSFQRPGQGGGGGRPAHRRPGPQLDITGHRYGRLVAIEWTGERDRWNQSLWRFRCDCGGERVASTKQVRAGRVRECRECAAPRWRGRGRAPGSAGTDPASGIDSPA